MELFLFLSFFDFSIILLLEGAFGCNDGRWEQGMFTVLPHSRLLPGFWICWRKFLRLLILADFHVASRLTIVPPLPVHSLRRLRSAFSFQTVRSSTRSSRCRDVPKRCSKGNYWSDKCLQHIFFRMCSGHPSLRPADSSSNSSIPSHSPTILPASHFGQLRCTDGSLCHSVRFWETKCTRVMFFFWDLDTLAQTLLNCPCISFQALHTAE